MAWVSGSPKRALNSRTCGTAGSDDEAAVEDADKGRILLGHASNGWLGNVVENPFVHAGFEHGVGGVDAHAAGIGAGVALANAFVVLCGDEGGNVLAV